MKKLCIITAIMFCAVSIQGASLYYQFPDARQFKDDDRMLIYQNASGNRNLTGAGLKSVIHQTAWDERYPRIFGTVTSSTIATQYVNAIRDRQGRITWLQWEDGKWFMGTPGYNHTYVYPFNNMTNVSRSTPLVIGARWLTRGFVGKQITIEGGPALSVKALKYMGVYDGLPNFDFWNESAPQDTQDAFYWGTNSVGMLAANTTYTIRSALARAWGDTSNGIHGIGADPCTYVMGNTSSAAVMENYSTNLCRSTFRTGSD